MLNVYEDNREHTPLPPKPHRIPLDKLYIKEAVGFAIWNGQRGTEARVYATPVPRKGYEPGVLRFLGCSAVPPPYSMASPMLQSLIWVRDHFDNRLNVSQEHGEDFVPLHILMSQNVELHATPDAPSTSVAPNLEIHGLLPATPAFIDRFHSQLERVWFDSTGRIQSQTGCLFTNGGMLPILRHILTQVQKEEGKMEVLTELNPLWNNGNYTPTADFAY